MANKKVDPAVKQVGVCGCVTSRVKQLLVEEAIRRQISLASVIGEVLEGWGVDKITVGEGGYLPYRHHQEEKERKEGKEYREGPLGKILRKTHSKGME